MYETARGKDLEGNETLSAATPPSCVARRMDGSAATDRVHKES